MIFKNVISLLIAVGTFLCSNACSTFLLNVNGQLLFGRNYDWVSGNGAVMTNARGVGKASFVSEGEKTITWTSKYGSITFNQFGREFPHGGMNEKGLVVELMWLDATTYPAADDRGALSELQWIQYQLDNCSTVEEVIAAQEKVRISNKNSVPLHFLVADATGNAATVEFIGGKLVAHKGSSLPYPVLTNSTYDHAVQQVKRHSDEAAFDDNSVSRFATACRLMQQVQKAGRSENAVNDAFMILDNVAQGDFTKWKIVYDISNRKIYVHTSGKRKEVGFESFSFACDKQPLFFDVNASLEGNAAAGFLPLTDADNKRILQRSAQESRGQVTVSEASINKACDFVRKLSCKH